MDKVCRFVVFKVVICIDCRLHAATSRSLSVSKQLSKRTPAPEPYSLVMTSIKLSARRSPSSKTHSRLEQATQPIAVRTYRHLCERAATEQFDANNLKRFGVQLTGKTKSRKPFCL